MKDRFQFQKFSVHHGPGALKVTTDACFLGALIEPEGARNMVDMGAGTGLLSLMVAQKAEPDSQIHAVENSLEAFGYLVENVGQSRFSQIIQPHPADVLRFAQEHAGVMDLVFTNPPFFRGIKRQDEGLSAALHMPPGLPQAWAEAACAMLKPGGRFYAMWLPEMLQEWRSITYNTGFGLKQAWYLAHAEGHAPIRVVALVEKGASDAQNLDIPTIFVRQKDSTLWSPAFYNLMRGYYLGVG